MHSKTFVGFNTGVYKYRRSRDHQDRIVRVRGFANTTPEAWAFMLHHRHGDGPLNAMYADGSEAALIGRLGKYNKVGLKLLWQLMPDDVQLAVEAFGGKRL